VAPYSGAMLAMVDDPPRAALLPRPKDSNELPDHFAFRSIWVTAAPTSVAVTLRAAHQSDAPYHIRGQEIDRAGPSIPASASMPPTPQPTMPSPLIIVVWESVPTKRVRGRRRVEGLRADS